MNKKHLLKIKPWYAKLLLAFFLTVFSSHSLYAYDLKLDGIYYNVNKDETSVTVTSGDNEYSGDIVIPGTIKDGSSRTLDVTAIGDNAFSYCPSLTSVYISEGVTSIGLHAFNSCTSLTSIYIPDGLMNIERGAFSSCASLTSISIPESVTSIGNGVFSFCSSITSITIAANNPVYDSREGCNAIIETSSNTLIAGCKNTIIPLDVTSIGDNAFSGCTSLTSISLPESVTSIKDYAFFSCYALTSISIPLGVTSIGNSAFGHCNSLPSISIPKCVTSIGEKAFDVCLSLTSVYISESVTSIGNCAFSFCESLTSINVAANNPVYDSREGCNAIIETSSNTLIAGCKNTIIPKSVTSIGEQAFYECFSLTSISIPENVTHIGDEAFSWCASLTSVICYAETVPELSIKVFGDVPTSEATLYVPASALEDYKAADQWKDFGTILPLEDIPAGISSIEADDSNAPYYTLDGIRVENPMKKGIYIKDGKKVLVK